MDKATDPLVKANPGIFSACQTACSVWAVKDMDFPPKGPLGFSFKLPAGFVADDKGQLHRPPPQPFPTTASPSKPDWLAKFVRTATLPDHDTKGACYYPKLPGAADCQIP